MNQIIKKSYLHIHKQKAWVAVSPRDRGQGGEELDGKEQGPGDKEQEQGDREQEERRGSDQPGWLPPGQEQKQTEKKTFHQKRLNNRADTLGYNFSLSQLLSNQNKISFTLLPYSLILYKTNLD